MNKKEFYNEVDTRALGLFEFRLDKKTGKWSTWLMPELLSQHQQQELPPGQEIYLGYSGYEVAAYDPPDREDWAARPYFNSIEAAQRMALYWIKTSRSDLYRDCIAETKEAVLWRKAQK